jgi:hypothetical protein
MQSEFPMPNATVRANARTLPKETAGRRATLKHVAALKFEPFSKEELGAINPPTNDEWRENLRVLRIAYAVLDGPEVFGEFASTIATLKGFAGMVACAEMRLMSAVGSLDKREGAR